MAIDSGKRQDTGQERPDQAEEKAGTDEEREGAEALNDARALQQMIEGTPDSSDEFQRIERKR